MLCIQWSICTTLQAHKATYRSFRSQVVPVLPAVHALRRRSDTSLVATSLETQRFWSNPRPRWIGRTLSCFRRCSSLPQLPGGKTEQWWNRRSVWKEGGEARCSKRQMAERREARGQEGNRNKSRVGIRSSRGSFLTVAYWQIAYGLRTSWMEIQEQF